MKRAFLFDTETTGLISNSAVTITKQPHIIELYGCLVEGEKVLDEIEFMVDPGVVLDSVITKITGITNDMVKGLSKFTEHGHLAQVQRLLSAADGAVAHNLSYDKNLVELEAKRLSAKVQWPAKLLCTVEATEHLVGHRLSLTALHEYLFGEAFSAHRAKGDVQALHRCYVELKKRGEL